jgi:hypothetical protein
MKTLYSEPSIYAILLYLWKTTKAPIIDRQHKFPQYFSLPDPNGHVMYCNHFLSVVIHKRNQPNQKQELPVVAMFVNGS